MTMFIKGPRPNPNALPPRPKPKPTEETGSEGSGSLAQKRAYRPSEKGGGIFACAKKQKGFDRG